MTRAHSIVWGTKHERVSVTETSGTRPPARWQGRPGAVGYPLDSPALDTGFHLPKVDTDFHGRKRPTDGNGNSTAEFDIGAIESPELGI